MQESDALRLEKCNFSKCVVWIVIFFLTFASLKHNELKERNPSGKRCGIDPDDEAVL
jgi:hypothetical protein